MTTICNFAEGNFIVNAVQHQVQASLWVLNATKPTIKTSLIVNNLISRCQQDKKPLIHLDLGLSVFKKIANDKIELKGVSGTVYIKNHPQSPYYIVQTSIKDRKGNQFLSQIIHSISQDASSVGALRKDKENLSPNNYEFGLLIQGLEVWSLLNKGQNHFESDLETFIGKLSNLDPKIRQIVIATKSFMLPNQANFLLERSSTCLTHLVSDAGSQWKCNSTVRRYTGYSNEQEYTISISKQGRIKVIKKKVKNNEQKTNEQKQMVDSLGFSVEKTENARKKEQQMRQMIFPHLKMRQMKEQEQKCGCLGQCKGNCGCASTEELFVLDDEQEDEDDIDV